VSLLTKPLAGERKNFARIWRRSGKRCAAAYTAWTPPTPCRGSLPAPWFRWGRGGRDGAGHGYRPSRRGPLFDKIGVLPRPRDALVSRRLCVARLEGYGMGLERLPRVPRAVSSREFRRLPGQHRRGTPSATATSHLPHAGGMRAGPRIHLRFRALARTKPLPFP
jgi:hypothetical protein